MALTLVSFTGPDDNTDITALSRYQQAFPLIEWAILTLPRKTGTPLYPTRSWIHRFLDSRPARTALHVCEGDVHNFINREPELWALAQRFDRVQVNFFQGRDPIDPAQLDATIRAYGKPVIVPYNPPNMVAVQALTAPNIHVIFDRSGGEGRLPDSWPAAIEGRFCTYAGGLGPDTVAQEFPRIAAAAGAEAFGIDMQTRIRDAQDRLCFEKIRSVALYCAGQAGLTAASESLRKIA